MSRARAATSMSKGTAWSRSRTRFDGIGKLTLLAGDPQWVMVRRPRAMPFVMSRREWDALGQELDAQRTLDCTLTRMTGCTCPGCGAWFNADGKECLPGGRRNE